MTLSSKQVRYAEAYAQTFAEARQSNPSSVATLMAVDAVAEQARKDLYAELRAAGADLVVMAKTATIRDRKSFAYLNDWLTAQEEAE